MHNRTWETASRQERSRRKTGTGTGLEALRVAMAALRSLNRDFTGEIPGASAPPAATGAERPPLSVTRWSAAACEGFKLPKVSPVPDQRLTLYSH